MRIAFFTDTYLPSVDGVVTSMLDVKAELERRGHHVCVFASGKRSSEYGDVFIYRGLKFRPYPQYNIALFPVKAIFKVKELKIDVVHSQTPFVMGFTGLISAKIYGLPLISTYHTILDNKDVVNIYYPKNKVLKRITKKSLVNYIEFFYKRCDEIIAPTRIIKKYVMSHYNIRHVEVVPNGVDTKRFKPADRPRKSGAKTILFVGRLSREKNLEVLLRSFMVLSKKMKLQLVIAGEGPARRHYENEARKLRINPAFLGYVQPKDLGGLYKSADVFCSPSNFETQGLVILEAMASGVPVVVSDRLGLSELVDGRNGEKFVPNDVNSCVGKLKKVLGDPGKYRKHALETARQYSVANIVDKLLAEYEKIIESNEQNRLRFS